MEVTVKKFPTLGLSGTVVASCTVKKLFTHGLAVECRKVVRLESKLRLTRWYSSGKLYG